MELAGALLIYPFLEEYIFRAQGMSALARRFPTWSPFAVNLATSLAFALSHLYAWPWQHAALVVLPSLWLGWSMQRWGSLTLCVALHAGMNLIYLAA